MACSSCGTENGLPKGCKNNGACGTAGCGKLSVFDWLVNMSQPVDTLRFPYVEVRFKNERKEFFHNSENLSLSMGDVVAVAASSGHDVGMVSLTGDLVRIQMKQKNVKPGAEILKIYRKANQRDIDVWQECREKEHQMMLDARRISRETGLDMKISDVEYQGDATKATFYYTSEERVDFRQLIRDFAAAFKTRIEMRQIGYRQEASKLGGIGSCGRELCCSTWLTDFRSVSTAAARYQQLSINPQKIAGQCGKLKCCLNYELDSYLDALKDFPKTDLLIESVNGRVGCAKIDVFKREMWLFYQNSSNFTWYKFTVDQVKGFLSENRNGNSIRSLEELYEKFNGNENLFSKDIIEESSIKRFESQNNRRRKNRSSKSNEKPVPVAEENQKRKPRKPRYNKKNGNKNE